MRRWDSIHHMEPDKVSVLLQQRHRMFAEEFCRGLCDPRHTQSALQTIDRAIDFQKTAPVYRLSKQEYIQIQSEPLPLRSDGNDWIATLRQRSMSSRPDRALPRREIPICESCCRRRRVRFGRRVWSANVVPPMRRKDAGVLQRALEDERNSIWKYSSRASCPRLHLGGAATIMRLDLNEWMNWFRQ